VRTMKAKTRKTELEAEKPLIQNCFVANPLDHSLGEEVPFIVDTGATCIVIPTYLAKRLKLKSVGAGEGILADGRKSSCDIVWLHITVDGQGVPTMALVMKNAQPLLGLDVMKMLQLQIDPARERLLKPLKRFTLIKMLFKKGVIPWKTSSSKH
jgi:predicted aspartyl protease